MRLYDVEKTAHNTGIIVVSPEYLQALADGVEPEPSQLSAPAG